MHFILLTGVSGAGKTIALHFFEDSGYFAVDNIPPDMLSTLYESCQSARRERVMAVTDARCGDDIHQLSKVLSQLRLSGAQVELFYLDANNEALVRRFKETRRVHPVFNKAAGSVLEAIKLENEMLVEARAMADKVIDTSNLTPDQLYSALANCIGEIPVKHMRITVESFGFKYGTPMDADLVFDVRFLTNPHYVPELKSLTGLSSEVADYVHQQPLTKSYLEQLFGFVKFTLPQYQCEGKAYLTIAIGCTGGHHRSVTIAEDLAKYLEQEGYHPTVHHRDIKRVLPLPEGI
jgi:UPF0042 nucleotide-binding protein